DDVNTVAGAEDVLLHLRVPAAGLMAEMNAGLQQLLHADFSHRILFLPLGPYGAIYLNISPPRAKKAPGDRRRCPKSRPIVLIWFQVRIIYRNAARLVIEVYKRLSNLRKARRIVTCALPQAFETLFALVLSRIVVCVRRSNNPFREWCGFIGCWVRSAFYQRRLHDLPFGRFRRHDGQSGAAPSKQHKRERGSVARLRSGLSDAGFARFGKFQTA